MITAFVIALILSFMQRINRTSETSQNTPGQNTGSTLTMDPDILLTSTSQVLQINADHALFDELLVSYVDTEGRVDYGSFKKDEARLDRYLGFLEANAPSGEETREVRMAYWINAYNAYTIKLILKNYPLSSIRELADGNIWDVRWIRIDDRNLSLNDIEHRILREQFEDPAIHFALNCAAASCPPLWNRAFTSENLERTLDHRARSFINDPTYNQIEKEQARLSKIFDWYREDFGALIPYINRYSETTLEQNAKIIFNDYDWSLNSK